MPHYANGELAQPGDIIQGVDFSGKVVEGLVVAVQECADCNLSVLPLPQQGRVTMMTKQCLPVRTGNAGGNVFDHPATKDLIKPEGQNQQQQPE